MSDLTGDGPNWARDAQTTRGALGRPIMPFDRLDAEWKAREAAHGTAVAAGFMAGLNFLSSLILSSGRTPEQWVLTRALNFSLPFSTLVAAIMLALIAARAHRAPSVVLAGLVLAWTVADMTMISRLLYGHSAYRYVSAFLIFVALLGLRGAMRLRRFEA